MEIEFRRVSRRPPWPVWAVLVVSGWLGLVGVAVWVSSRTGVAVELCMFKRVTGVGCVTCGATRGVLSLMHGQAAQAWLYNPLVFSVLPFVGAALLFRLVFGLQVRARLGRFEWVMAWVLATGVLAANWVYVIYHVDNLP